MGGVEWPGAPRWQHGDGVDIRFQLHQRQWLLDFSNSVLHFEQKSCSTTDHPSLYLVFVGHSASNNTPIKRDMK